MCIRDSHHGTSLRGREPTPAGAAPSRRPGQHCARDRAQPRRDQDGRLDHRSRPRGRAPRWAPRRRGHARDGLHDGYRDRRGPGEGAGGPPHHAGDSNARLMLQRPSEMPSESGCYLFRNDRGAVIYVGKARSLAQRLTNYFQRPESLDAKTRVLMDEAASVEWIVTHSEVDALILENELTVSYTHLRAH